MELFFLITKTYKKEIIPSSSWSWVKAISTYKEFNALNTCSMQLTFQYEMV